MVAGAQPAPGADHHYADTLSGLNGGSIMNGTGRHSNASVYPNDFKHPPRIVDKVRAQLQVAKHHGFHEEDNEVQVPLFSEEGEVAPYVEADCELLEAPAADDAATDFF